MSNPYGRSAYEQLKPQLDRLWQYRNEALKRWEDAVGVFEWAERKNRLARTGACPECRDECVAAVKSMNRLKAKWDDLWDREQRIQPVKGPDRQVSCDAAREALDALVLAIQEAVVELREENHGREIVVSFRAITNACPECLTEAGDQAEFYRGLDSLRSCLMNLAAYRETVIGIMGYSLSGALGGLFRRGRRRVR